MEKYIKNIDQDSNFLTYDMTCLTTNALNVESQRKFYTSDKSSICLLNIYALKFLFLYTIKFLHIFFNI